MSILARFRNSSIRIKYLLAVAVLVLTISVCCLYIFFHTFSITYATIEATTHSEFQSRFSELERFTYMKQAEKTEGVYCSACDIISDHFVGAEAYSNNDMAIAAGSSNPERAAMVLDMLKFDTYLNRLILIGIEGEHYTINDQGEYTLTDKGCADYPPMVVSASWAIKNGNLTEAGAPKREKALSDA